MAWKWPWSDSEKEKPKKKKQVEKNNIEARDLLAKIHYKINSEGKSKSEATLEELENVTRIAQKQKKEMEDRFERESKEFEGLKQRKFDELKKTEEQRQLAFRQQMKDAEKVQNQLLLAMDVCKREIEIANLKKGLSLVAKPSEMQIILDKLSELNKKNARIEACLKQNKVDVEILDEIKARLNGEQESDGTEKEEDSKGKL